MIDTRTKKVIICRPTSMVHYCRRVDTMDTKRIFKKKKLRNQIHEAQRLFPTKPKKIVIWAPTSFLIQLESTSPMYSIQIEFLINIPFFGYVKFQQCEWFWVGRFNDEEETWLEIGPKAHPSLPNRGRCIILWPPVIQVIYCIHFFVRQI